MQLKWRHNTNWHSAISIYENDEQKAEVRFTNFLTPKGQVNRDDETLKFRKGGIWRKIEKVGSYKVGLNQSSFTINSKTYSCNGNPLKKTWCWTQGNNTFTVTPVKMNSLGYGTIEGTLGKESNAINVAACALYMQNARQRKVATWTHTFLLVIMPLYTIYLLKDVLFS